MKLLFAFVLAASLTFAQNAPQKPAEQTAPGPKQEKPVTKPPTAKPSASEQPKPGAQTNKQANAPTPAQPQTPLKEFPYTPGHRGE